MFCLYLIGRCFLFKHVSMIIANMITKLSNSNNYFFRKYSSRQLLKTLLFNLIPSKECTTPTDVISSVTAASNNAPDTTPKGIRQ